MGTGVGGGVVVNGKVLNGAQGIGGEWGHNFLDASGGPCYCSKTGCVETLLSGTGLQQFYQSPGRYAIYTTRVVQRYHQGGDGQLMQLSKE